LLFARVGLLAAALRTGLRNPLLRSVALHAVKVLLGVRADLGSRAGTDVGGDTSPVAVEETESLDHAGVFVWRPHGTGLCGCVGFARAGGSEGDGPRGVEREWERVREVRRLG
jgi:hypothetical protein